MKAVRQFVSAQYRYDRLHFCLGILVALSPAAAGVLLLGVSGWFVTAAAVAGLSGVLLNIFVPSAIIRALALVRTAGRYGERVLTHDATFRFLSGLRNSLFARYSAQRPQGRRSALILNRLTLDIDTLDLVYLRLVVPLIIAGVTGAGLLVFWATISLPILLTGAVFLGAWAGLAWISFSRVDTKTARRVDAASDAIRLRAADLASGRRDLAVYGGLEAAAEAVFEADQRLRAAEDDEDRRIHRLTGASSFIGQFFLAAMLLICVWRVLAGDITTPLAAGLVLIVIALPEIAGMLLPGLARLPRTALAADRSISMERSSGDWNFEPLKDRKPVVESSTEDVLSFKDVSFQYPGAARNVIDCVSFAIRQGETIAVAGRSGCGKSTLAALASRIRQPDRGIILLRNMPLNGVPEAQLRRNVTMIGQRPHIFNDTIAANLRIANNAASDAELWSALERAALADRVSQNSDGLQTVLGEEGLGLSGGEKRRLALARCFLTDPDLFILDEMTEGLDDHTASDVLSRFFEFRGQAAVLMIAHKKLELACADRILRLPDAPARSC